MSGVHHRIGPGDGQKSRARRHVARRRTALKHNGVCVIRSARHEDFPAPGTRRDYDVIARIDAAALMQCAEIRHSDIGRLLVGGRTYGDMFASTHAHVTIADVRNDLCVLSIHDASVHVEPAYAVCCVPYLYRIV